ncbi:hypothetical protein PORY_001013 [Pneumocystis oryctolagi]|uniref:Uncharacterized protein n=1 Tax=Pneumocystis oryctolagi TaxID=42067 RepID=A0ACB7CFZ7_9ASCO|nr:hypothetical protein PORY_001013 [Pneumocystis oryctolagi]
MLHELLLHLAAHTSGLFDTENETLITSIDFHPAEKQLLTQLHHLAQQHLFIRRTCSTVCCSRYSIIGKNRHKNSYENICNFGLCCIIRSSVLSAIEQQLHEFNSVLCELERRFLLHDTFFINVYPKFELKQREKVKQSRQLSEQEQLGENTDSDTYNQSSQLRSSLQLVSPALLVQTLRPWFRRMDYLEKVASRFNESSSKDLNDTLDDASNDSLNNVSNKVSKNISSNISGHVPNVLDETSNGISNIALDNTSSIDTVSCGGSIGNFFSSTFDIKLMNQLAEDVQCHSGDIQTLACSLLCAAQKAWITTVLPLIIGINLSPNINFNFDSNLNTMLVQFPDFVSTRTANDIWMIGRAMRQLHSHWGITGEVGVLNGISSVKNATVTSSVAFNASFNDIYDIPDFSLMIKEQTVILSSLEYPLSVVALEIAIRQIKEICVQRIFKRLLSLEMINNWAQLLNDYYLLQYSEFVFCFLREVLNKQKVVKISKQTQVSVLLIRTFKELSRIEERYCINESISEITTILHRRMFSLLISKDAVHNTSFSDLLIGIPIVMSFSIPWPLTLFFSEQDIKYYSNIFFYLIAIRHAQTRLSELWKGRRCIIVTPNRIVRSHWAIASHILYFLDNLWEYFQTIVIQPEYQKFFTSFSKDFNYDSESFHVLHQQFLKDLTKKLFLKNDNFLIVLKKIFLSVNLVVSVISSSFINDHTTLQQIDEKLIKGLIKQIICIIEEIGHTDVDLKLINHLLLRMEF